MKTVILTLVSLISLSASARGLGETNARMMSNILKNPRVQTLINENKQGAFYGIKYAYSGRAAFGPMVYELTFLSGTDASECVVTVETNLQTGELFDSPLTCATN